MDGEPEIEALVRGGELEPAAARLLDVHGAEIYGLLVQHVGDAEAGEAFAKLGDVLRARLASFSFRYSPRTLLYAIARREVHDRARSASIKTANDRVGALRESLDPDDRILLTLRIDRELAWDDIARVLHDVDEPGEVATEGIRKRFAVLKDRLHQRANDAAALNPTITAAGATARPRSGDSRVPELVGRAVGGYQIRELLGGGGMGVVWVAEHVKLGRKAVIKFMQDELADDAVHVHRFLNEAKTTAAIRHPGIVEVFDFSTDERGRPYIAMELLAGESLHARLHRESRLPVDVALAITAQIAAAVGAAHAAGVVHRDLKPGNVFLVPDRDSPHGVHVKVLDFGLAKVTLGDEPGVTRTGICVGTPRYMSPEQCRSKAPVDARTDVYSLGCILFEMVCGRPPFLGKAVGELMLAHSSLPPPVPSELVASISPALDRTILKMLAKEPEQRFSSMQQVASAVAQIAGTAPPDELLATPVARPMRPSQPPVIAVPPVVVEPPVPASRKALGAIALVVVVVLAVTLILIFG